jgi:hypothetical protein
MFFIYFFIFVFYLVYYALYFVCSVFLYCFCIVSSQSGRSVVLTTHIHLAPRLKKE